MTVAQIVDAKWHARRVEDHLHGAFCFLDTMPVASAAHLTKAHEEFRALARSLGYDVTPAKEAAA